MSGLVERRNYHERRSKKDVRAISEGCPFGAVHVWGRGRHQGLGAAVLVTRTEGKAPCISGDVGSWPCRLETGGMYGNPADYKEEETKGIVMVDDILVLLEQNGFRCYEDEGMDAVWVQCETCIGPFWFSINTIEEAWHVVKKHTPAW